MNGVSRHFPDQSRRNPHRFDCRVVGQHRYHHVAVEHRFRPRGDGRSATRKRIGGRPRTVPHHELMPALDKPSAHAAAHLPESNKAYFHRRLLLN